MVEINGTILIQIANFLVLIFILNIVLYKPIRSILRQRKEKMQGLENSAQSTAQQAEERNQAYTDGLKEARLKGQKEKEVLMKAATEEEQAMVAKINAKAQQDLATVKDKIAKDTDAVRNALEKEIDAFAGAITQKILGRTA
ncbi:MAG: ATP synthase F0 subunit B [Desulfatitalea sp.]|nr:ATP synthase F0 subunit B [Desulfatitalea sp.]